MCPAPFGAVLTLYTNFPNMNKANMAKVSLPAAISVPAAWAAYKYVADSEAWDLSVLDEEAPRVCFICSPEFEGILDGACSGAYQDQARSWIAMRIMEIADGTHDLVLRQYVVGQLQDGPASFRRFVLNRVREEIDEHFSIDKWEEDLRGHLSEMPRSFRQRVEGYVGLDLRVSLRACDKAVKYIFSRCAARLVLRDGAHVLCGNHNMDTVRRYEGREERDVANHLIVSVADSVLAEMDMNDPDAVSLDAILTKVRDIVVHLLRDKGVWGLIHRILPARRARISFEGDVIDDVLHDLVSMQETRMRNEAFCASR